MTDLHNAFSDWSTAKECRPTVRRDVGDELLSTFFVLATNVADVFMGRRRLSATFLDKCKQAVSRSQVPYTTENMYIC